jgi:hypothetical protein
MLQEGTMDQVHKRFSDEQVVFLLQAYSQGLMTRVEVQEVLGVSKSRFFALWRDYRSNPEAFSISYQRTSPGRISSEAEAAMARELLREKALIDDPNLPISSYNYSALRDRLKKQGVEVSLNTIIDRAMKLGCHHPVRKRKAHDREVLTASPGALIQHDGSHHLWSPYATEKWTLITSIDDFSRKLLFADFFPAETTWAHIQATQTLIQTYGVPLCFYVDSLRAFRFVQRRDSFWRKHVLQTDDVDTQWGKMMSLLGVQVTFALSPQAKGKVERPYRWLQDRIVRTCALERLHQLEEVRAVLHEELERYNNHQVHSTTREIPSLRFDKAIAQGNTLFRPFSLPKPYTSTKDIFCLRELRKVDAYRRISLFGHQIQMPRVPPHEEVAIHMTPDADKQVMELRLWWNGNMVHPLSLPLQGFRVHF